ncbi:MAG TPA: 3-hydroxyacyl-CoA dehydrogenase NAD-binding domain-containing protein, partial [Rugosimonospora sp.]|nr:3-hydroxyacyl-CoA dehydrogenase NAD-binding domain-containing protein [Rugosimonospora sp.]
MAGRLIVVGAGLMGSGIAQVAAAAGWDVTMRDVSDEALARGRDGIGGSLGRFVAKGTLSAADAVATLGRIGV